MKKKTSKRTAGRRLAPVTLLAALVDFAEGQAYCPCCTGVYACGEGCTIKEDCKRVGGDTWVFYERMMAARDALSANVQAMPRRPASGAESTQPANGAALASSEEK